MSQTIIRIPGKLVGDEYGTPLVDRSEVNDDIYGPYLSVTAAHSALSAKGLNIIGQTVAIASENNTVVEYWYQGGTAQVNLVQKQQGGGTVDAYTKAQSDAKYATKTELNAKANTNDVNAALGNKQDTIQDLNTIRSGANAGASAYQKPGTGVPKSDLASAVQTSLNKADSAQQPATTLAGYGITDGATKSELQALESEVDSKLADQDDAIALLDGHEVVITDDHTTIVSPDTQKIYREPYHTEQIDGQGTAAALIGNDYYSYMLIDAELSTVYKAIDGCVFLDTSASPTAIIGDTITTPGTGTPSQYYAIAKQVASPSDVADLSYTKTNDDVTPTKYTDWMCTDNTTTPVAWKKIATYNLPGVDNKPTAGSDKLVKSGGVAAALEPLQKGLEQFDSTVNKTLIQGDNLINLNSPGVIDNSYINTEGNIDSNPDFRITDYIPVTPGKTYYSGNNGSPAYTAIRTFEFYNENKIVIPGSFVNNNSEPYITSFTAPANAAYFRASEDKRSIDKPQLNVDSLKPYSEYIAPHYVVNVKGSKLEDESISLDKLIDKEGIEKSIEAAELFKTVYGDNLINLNSSGVVDNSYINSEGSTASLNNFFITDYIPVIPGKTYYAGYNGVADGSVLRTFEFYDENKAVIQGSFVNNNSDPTIKMVTAPVGAAYFRTSVNKYLLYPQLNEGSLKPYSEYIEPYTALNGSSIEDNSITLDKLTDKENIEKSINVSNLFKSAYGDNLININSPGIIDNSYINAEGSIGSNNTYFITDYIPVIPGKTYYAGRAGEPSYTVLRTFEFYYANKTVISGSFVNNTVVPYIESVTAPANAAFFRCSIEKRPQYPPQLNVDSLKPYSEYIEPYTALNGSSIEDKSIIENKLSLEVRQKINSSKSNKVNSFTDSDILHNDSYLSLPLTHIKKNNFLVCDIVGSISSVSVGVGYWNDSSIYYRGYASEWAEIDATNVKIYRAYGGTPSLVSNQAHGRTLTGKTKVIMDFGLETATIKIFNDLGDVYEGAMQIAGVGMPFVYNGGASNITCTLSDFPRDLSKKVWLFGDSYVTFEDSARWPYYLKQYGYTNYLCVAQPGLSPDIAVTELRNLLELGYTPSLLVWTLGMNGNTQESQSGGEYVINSYQKINIDAVVQICEEYGIELVLGVIPTVPERQKTGFGNYVKSLGVRYIDFAKAVGTNSSGQWNTGLLSSDNVHPTALGAKVLASQVLADCPELTIND